MNKLTDSTKGFIGHCKFEKNLSDKTIKAYQTDLNQFHSFLIDRDHSTAINEITKLDFRDYLESISGLKPKSIKRKIATLKALFNYLEFDDLISINPLRKMRIRIKEPRRLPKALSIKDVTSIFRSVYATYNNSSKLSTYGCFTELRDIAVIELLFATGGRVSEISNLKSEQIDLRSGQIILKGKGDKERIIQICNRETITALKKYHKVSLEKIKAAGGHFLINRFNSQLSDQSIRGIVRRHSKAGNLQMHVTPHVFRHSFATLLLEKDVDIKYIQSMLGHSSIVTTQIYTHVNKEKQRQILKAKHPRKDFSIDVFSCPE